MEFEVRELERNEYAEWDSLVDYSPQGTIFHKTSWLAAMNTYDFKLLICTYKKNIVGGIPLPYIQRFGVRFAINPPFTPYLGVIFRESRQKYSKKLSFEKKISRALAINIKDFAPYLEYSFHHNFIDLQPFIWAGFSLKLNYTYLLDLKQDLGSILQNMAKETRNRIVTSSKAHVDFLDALPDEMIELIFLTYQRKNQKLPYSKRAYDRYVKILFKNKTVKSIIAKDKEGNSIAGGLIVYDNQRAYYLAGCINPKSENSGLGSLIIWNLIEYSKSLGLTEFDFEGSMNENIERFFRGFGGKLAPKSTIYKNNLMHSLANIAIRVQSRF